MSANGDGVINAGPHSAPGYKQARTPHPLSGLGQGSENYTHSGTRIWPVSCFVSGVTLNTAVHFGYMFSMAASALQRQR